MTSQVMTTDEIRKTRQPAETAVGLTSAAGFELTMRIANMLTNSTMVPEQFRHTIMVKDRWDNSTKKWSFKEEANPNGLSNCVIAINMANRMGADPLMIMQNLYLVEGRPSWSSQFIIAAINGCGRYSPLRFEVKDLGEKEVTYLETTWESGKKQTLSKTIKIQNISCTAWAIERETGEKLESSIITMEMAVKEGWYQKNGSKWQTMPEQMLRYRAASFFGRIYAPDLLMGLRSADEEQERIIDITPDAMLEQEPEPKAVENFRKTRKQKAADIEQPDDKGEPEQPPSPPVQAEPVQQPEPQLHADDPERVRALIASVQSAKNAGEVVAIQQRYMQGLSQHDTKIVTRAMKLQIAEFSESQQSLTDRLEQCADMNDLAILSQDIELLNPDEQAHAWSVYERKQAELTE